MSCLILQGATILNPVVLDKQGGPNKRWRGRGGEGVLEHQVKSNKREVRSGMDISIK